MKDQDNAGVTENSVHDELSENYGDLSGANEDATNTARNADPKVVLENSTDNFQIPGANVADENEYGSSNQQPGAMITRSSQVSSPCDHSKSLF